MTTGAEMTPRRRPGHASRVDERRAGEPGPPLAMIFGDGGHPTTALVRAALTEEVVRRRAGGAPPRVLDAGCGTGALAAAAILAGAGDVLAVDRAPEAVRETRHRLARTASAAAGGRNTGAPSVGLPAAGPWRIEVRAGDLADLLPDLGAFDIVAANLPEPEVGLLTPALAGAVAPGGLLLLTGLPLWRAAALERAAWASGLTPRQPRAREGWALLLADRI